MIPLKIKPPFFQGEYVKRRIMLNKLTNCQDKKLIYIHAPAGYGKSVLLSQYTAEHKYPVAWYQMDSFDNDLRMFFYFLTGMVTFQIPDFAIVLSDDHQNDEINFFYDYLSAFINKLEEMTFRHLTLIFDDFQVINNPVIFQFIELLVKYLPPKVQLIIAGRHVPNFRMDRLKAMRIAAEFDVYDLAMNREEYAELFSSPTRPADFLSVNKDLIDLLEGWPLGLDYFRNILNKSGDGEWSPTQGLPNLYQNLYDFFRTEIFNPLPKEVQDFLGKIALVEEITTDLGNIILERSDCQRMLDKLLAENLFLFRTQEEPAGYRLQSMFKKFLTTYRINEQPGIFQKAGQYYRRKGDCVQAIGYFMKAGDIPTAVEIIAQSGMTILQPENMQLLKHWLESTYRYWRNSSLNPRLCIVWGAICSYRGLYRNAKRWIEPAFSELNDGEDGDSIYHARLHQARILRHYGFYGQSLDLIDRLTPVAEFYSEIEQYDLVMEKVKNLWLQGNFLTALQELQEAEILWNDPDGKLKAGLNKVAAQIYYFAGEYSKSRMLYENSENDGRYTEAGFEGYSVRPYIAGLYQNQGDLQKAGSLLDEELAFKRRIGILDELWFVYYRKALWAVDMGDLEQAQQSLEYCQGVLHQTQGHQSFYNLVYATKGWLRIIQGYPQEGKKIC
jgi:ATP/maltotriose-dependent transcriptional regulator MalT